MPNKVNGVEFDPIREKLIALIDKAQMWGASPKFENTLCFRPIDNDVVADHLIANGVTVQEWISVKYRLPELHTKVLCCGIKGGRFIAELGTWGHEKHLYWDKKNGQGCPTVTHWMPLPQPPKGE